MAENEDSKLRNKNIELKKKFAKVVEEKNAKLEMQIDEKMKDQNSKFIGQTTMKNKEENCSSFVSDKLFFDF